MTGEDDSRDGDVLLKLSLRVLTNQLFSYEKAIELPLLTVGRPSAPMETPFAYVRERVCPFGRLYD